MASLLFIVVQERLAKAIVSNFWKMILQEDTEAISSGGHKMIMAKQELQELEKYVNHASFLVAAGLSNPEVVTWIIEARKAAFCLKDQIDMYSLQGSNEARLYRLKSKIGMFSIRKLTEIIQYYKNKMPAELQTLEVMSHLPEISPFIRYSHPVSTGTLIGMDSEIKKVEDFLTSVHLVLFMIGGQGSGKTALMKHIYEKIKDDFDLSYWVDIAKTEGLVGLLKTFLKGSVDPDVIHEFEIMKTIHGIFHGKRYLIVLDDVQDTSVLYNLKHVLKHFNGKIICLTRRTDIQGPQDTYVKREDIQEVLFISRLNPCYSRMLLMHAAFPDITSIVGDDVFFDALPNFSSTVGDDLEETMCRMILSKCRGNPWNIWTIGMLFRYNPLDKWSEIGERVDGMLIDDTIKNEKRDPPIQLEDAILDPAIRDSFLYCLAFPEKSEVLGNSGIPTRKLIRLWMAEGYLQDSPRESQEKEAKSLLEELINKKLLVVNKKGFDGEVLQCSVNEHIRPLALKMCEHQKFCRFVPGNGDETSLSSKMTKTKFFPTLLRRKKKLSDRYRMLAVHGDQGVKEASKALGKDTRLRSLLYFKAGRTLELPFQFRRTTSYRLLWTLELQGTRLADLPSSISCLVSLRYLGLRNTELEDLPPALRRLKYLMCLDIRDTNIAEVDDVSAFTEMRHLYLANSFRSQSVLIKEGLQSLIYLQKLSGASFGVSLGRQSPRMVPFEQEISNLKRLMKLSVKKVSSPSSRNICHAINGMEFLQSLTITCDGEEQFDISSLKIGKNLRKLKLGGQMDGFYGIVSMMQSITYLYLWDSNLPVPHDPLKELQGLENLLLLCLYNAYMGKSMSCDNGYRKLKKLSIISMENITECSFCPEIMKNLEELVFAKCAKLASPPEGIDRLDSLREVHLGQMLPEFCIKAKESLRKKEHVRVQDSELHFHTSGRATTGGS